MIKPVFAVVIPFLPKRMKYARFEHLNRNLRFNMRVRVVID